MYIHYTVPEMPVCFLTILNEQSHNSLDTFLHPTPVAMNFCCYFNALSLSPDCTEGF